VSDGTLFVEGIEAGRVIDFEIMPGCDRLGDMTVKSATLNNLGVLTVSGVACAEGWLTVMGVMYRPFPGWARSPAPNRLARFARHK
jgi:hypothetical protein